MAVFQSFAFEQDLGARQEVDYLVVGGGASGGNNYGGGGGAGGFRSGSFSLVTNQAYAIIVGDGGFAIGGTATGINGAKSAFFGIESAGGGAGGFTAFTTLNTARNGGSGGGGGGARRGTNNRGLGNTPSTSPAQGQNGGNGGSQASNGPGGGGGGALNAGGTGPDSTSAVAGVGGSGSLWLDNVRYAGGGGGAGNTATVGALGGPGGGGRGSATGVASTTGSKNTGGGGGSNSRNGGSGIVKFRYPGEPKPELKGGNITTVDGFTYHEFTSSQFLYYNADEQKNYNDNDWTPASFTGARHWWRADLGTTLSGNNVTVWEDQINGYKLQNPNSALTPIYSSSVAVLNNKPAICTNGTSQFLYTTASLRDFDQDLYMMFVGNVVTGSSGGTIFGATELNTVQATRLRVWTDTFGGNYRIVYTSGSGAGVGFGVKRVNTLPTGSMQHFLVKYTRADGLLGQSTGSISTLNFDYGMAKNMTQWQSGSTVCLGSSVSTNSGSVALGRYVKIELAEALIAYNNTPDEDLVKWKNYVQNRYGLDLT